jgi:hypothetical protein
MADAAEGIIQVSKGGRGFVVAGKRERFVITAGHLLPKLPPFHGASPSSERNFAKLLGPLGGRCDVGAACLFANPIADLGVLGSPDSQELSEPADAYKALVESVTPLVIVDLPLKRERIKVKAALEGKARLLSLDGRWFRCTLWASSRALWIKDAAEPIVGGMSGSPILNDDGAAVGIICVATGPNPLIARQLPRWLLDEIE